MPSQTELLIAGLKVCGWTLDMTARTNKYKVYVHSKMGRKMLVGKSGGLRWVATDAPVSESHSLTGTNYHKALMTVGSRASCYTTEEQARTDLVLLAKGKS